MLLPSRRPTAAATAISKAAGSNSGCNNDISFKYLRSFAGTVGSLCLLSIRRIADRMQNHGQSSPSIAIMIN